MGEADFRAAPSAVVSLGDASPPARRQVRRGKLGIEALHRPGRPDDLMNFLNSEPPFGGARDVVRITATNKDSHLELIVSYQNGGTTG